MALGIREKIGADWGMSVTGIAGPAGGTETKPVGLVYLGLAGPAGFSRSGEYRFGSSRGRELVRQLSAATALDQLRRLLIGA
jgi:nicotinamide-nucleotide amidase